jgi:putative PIN family toxin of toxin-antitoxin system
MSTAPGVEIRAVLDTNVLVSAFTRPTGRVVQLWQAARERRYRLLVSSAIIREVAHVLRDDFRWDERRIVQHAKLLTRTGELIFPHVALDVIRNDPDDNRILECAVEGKADVIVSGDRHLRDLKSHQGIPVVRPIDFLRTLGVV